MKTILTTILLCAWPLAAQIGAQIIDCGSGTDLNYVGGSSYRILAPELSDPTLRYGTSFSYKIPEDNVPYVVTLRFVEPSVQVAGARVFSVSINNQPMLAGMDLVVEAGYQKPVSRSMVVTPSEGVINISFTTQVRSAVVSSIEITPVSQVWLSGRCACVLKEKSVAVQYAPTITLPDTPLPNTLVRLYWGPLVQILDVDFTVSGNVVSLNGTDWGDVPIVITYFY